MSPKSATIPVTDEPDLATVLSLLDESRVRFILAETSQQAMSATELAERCDASLPTVYRHVEELADAGLVSEHTRPRSDGHHDTVYAATLERVVVELDDGEFTFDLETGRSDPARELTELWEKF